MAWQITNKFIIVPKNFIPQPSGTPTPTPIPSSTPTPTPTNTPQVDAILLEDNNYLLQEDNSKILL